MSELVLSARGVEKTFHQGKLLVPALRGVDLELRAGEFVALVGPSGSGKTTFLNLAGALDAPTAGELEVLGKRVAGLSRAERAELRLRSIGFVFQAYNLVPVLTAQENVEFVLELQGVGAERRKQAVEVLEELGLRDLAGRRPAELSGGQQQRVAIARAISTNPRFIVLDEPVSGLDVSIRAQVLNLLAELQEAFQLAYVFVSHDLSVVRHIADRVLVIYLGRAVEIGTRDAIFEAPQHPYTRALLSATPMANPGARRERILLKGELPSPFDPPTGCVFHPRCPLAFDRCPREVPQLEGEPAHQSACFAVKR